jgi:hypothetical protein
VGSVIASGKVVTMMKVQTFWGTRDWLGIDYEVLEGDYEYPALDLLRRINSGDNIASYQVIMPLMLALWTLCLYMETEARIRLLQKIEDVVG